MAVGVPVLYFFERRFLMLAVESFKQTPVQSMTIAKSRIAGNAIGMLLNSENQKETSRGVSLFFHEIAMNKKVENLKPNRGEFWRWMGCQ